MDKNRLTGKVVALTSGGVDSSVMVYHLRSRGFKVLPVFVDYGQRARERELLALDEVLSSPLRKSLAVIRIPGTAAIGRGALFEANTGDFWVPHRNLLLLTTAAMYAEGKGANLIATGLIGEASVRVPDADFAFLKLVSRTLTKSAGSAREVIAPLANLTKTEVVELGLGLRVPLERTYSCFVGSRTPCGRCPACRVRAHAFRMAGRKPHGDAK